MNMDTDNLPVFDENTLYEITLKPNQIGACSWTRGSVLVKNRNGATRGLFRLLCRYLFPEGTVELVNGEVRQLPVAPTLQKQVGFIQKVLPHKDNSNDFQSFCQNQKVLAATKLEQVEAISEWAMDRDGFFTSSTPAMDAELTSIFEEGDERTIFVLLYRFLSSLVEFDLVIKDSDIEVFDR